MSDSAELLFYGDDFTGATDALGTAARAGLRSLLFLGVPGATRLAAAGPLDCIGIAGAARSMGLEAMRRELQPVAELARRLKPRVLHYKTCSTFDSAPEVGSIGEAVRLLAPALGAPRLHIVGGQPGLGRYCLFGNLFAAAGAAGEVFRIDRHPTMSRHPVTPMGEADLRLHLARQGLEEIRLVPWTAYAEDEDPLALRLDGGAGPLLWDVGDADHLACVGRQLLRQAKRQPLLAVGPSSVVEALAHAMHSRVTEQALRIAPVSGPVLVLAGSLSPVTAAQVEAAKSFELLRLPAERLVAGAAADGGTGAGAMVEEIAQDIAARLAAGRHVLACTVAADGSRSRLPADSLARAGGALLREVLRRSPQTRRVGIAGGDTSSLAVRALDAWALSYCGLLAPGVPLCRLHSDDAGLDGVELMLKGGQMGGVDVFERLVA